MTGRWPRVTQSQVTGKNRTSGGEAGSPPRGNGGSRQRGRQVGSRDRPGGRFLRRPARHGSRGACPVEGPTRAGHLRGCVSWTNPGDRREGGAGAGRESAAGAKTLVGGRGGAGGADFRGRDGSLGSRHCGGPGGQRRRRAEAAARCLCPRSWRGPSPPRAAPSAPLAWASIHLQSFFSVGGPLLSSTWH